MLTDQQLGLALAGVCVLAAVIMVLARRRRRSEPTASERPAQSVTGSAEPGWMVLARTHDGSQYQGALVQDDDTTRDQYLVMAGPIVFRRAGGEPETMPPAWDRLAVPLTDVAEVWTRPAPTSPAPAPSARTADERLARAAREAATSALDSDVDGATSVGDTPRAQRRSHLPQRATADAS